MLKENEKNNMHSYVFIHGLGQNASSWDKTISKISKLSRVYCPDLFTILNHKDSTYENLYHAFSNYCHNIAGELNLCGLSLGAILALNYAIDYPEKVQSIVLIGAQYKMPKMLLKLQNVIFRIMPKRFFTTMGFEKKNILKLTNSLIELDFTNELKNITIPTTIICGEKDNANKKAANGLNDCLPNTKFYLLKNTGHEINVEAPEQLAAILCAAI